MVKRSIVFTIIFILIITFGILETNYINNQFSYLNQELDQAIESVKTESTQTDIIDKIIEWWHGERKKLNSFIPHNEIKEIDALLSETRSFINTGNFNIALSRLEKLKNYAANIPNSFAPHFENIF